MRAGQGAWWGSWWTVEALHPREALRAVLLCADGMARVAQVRQVQ